MFVRTSQHRFTNGAHFVFVSLRVTSCCQPVNENVAREEHGREGELARRVDTRGHSCPRNRRGRETRS